VAQPGKTEKPTGKRRQEARDQGRVAKSHDLSAAAIFLAIIIALHVGFNATVSAAAKAFAYAMSHIADRDEPTIRSVWELFARDMVPFMSILAFAFGAAVFIAIAANLAQFGLIIAPNMLKPNFGKLNPFTGLSRIFISTQTFVQLGKQLIKLSVVGAIVYSQVKDRLETFIALAHAPAMDIVNEVEQTTYAIAVRFGILLFIIGCIDYRYEKWRIEQSLMMSKSEVKEEAKQAEGSPEAKGAVKKRQRDAARRRMMAAVPRATVVVTNPTHFAVALEWDEDRMAAPVLVAKGADLMAKRIRETAAQHNIPILENPPLARTLYDKVPLDSPIPPNLYAAVAGVIAFVYRLKNRTVA